MRKSILLVLLTLAVLLPMPLHAMDFTLGAKAGYYVWRPWLMDMDKVMWEGVQPGSGILYGPVLSLVITPDVSVSVAGLFGTQSTAWSDNNNQKWFGPSEVLASGLYSAEMDRMDIDGAVSVRMTDNLKLFAGYKYQMIEFSMEASFKAQDVLTSAERFVQGDAEMEIPAHGPAAGVGYSQPFGGSFFATVNLSGLYMWSKLDELKWDWTQYEPKTLPPPPGFTPSSIAGSSPAIKTRQIGLNAEPAIGAFIGDNVIATLGVRFQWMRIEIVEETEIMYDYGWMNDYLYGVFVSVLYTF